jgi:hypothetical protein
MAVIKATSEGSVQFKGTRLIATSFYSASNKNLLTAYPLPLVGITITQKQASIGMGAFTALALIWLLSHIFWWTLSTSGFLTGVHMLLRDASMHKDEEDKVEMSGDLAMSEEASFLNGGEIA